MEFFVYLNNMSKMEANGNDFLSKESILFVSGVFKFKKSVSLISEVGFSRRHELWRETKAKMALSGQSISGGLVRGCTCGGEVVNRGSGSCEFWPQLYHLSSRATESHDPWSSYPICDTVNDNHPTLVFTIRGWKMRMLMLFTEIQVAF